MRNKFENILNKTSILIRFDEVDFHCYYHPLSNKSYYKVNDEFLLILNDVKEQEIKLDYYKHQRQVYIGSVLCGILFGMTGYYLLNYVNRRKTKSKYIYNGQYKIESHPVSIHN